MKRNKPIEAKVKSMVDKSENSRDSETGYMDTGNPATVHARARAMRNNDNGSHY
jgi:hypothetical protein